MLDVFALHLYVKETVLTALRILQTKHLKPGDMVGHIKILDEILTESMTMPSDLIPVQLDFESTVEVAIIHHQEVEPFLTQLPKHAFVWSLGYRCIQTGLNGSKGVR